MKRSFLIIPAAALVLALVGCAGSPIALGLSSDGELSTASDGDVINAYRFGNGNKRMREELERRGTFLPSEWERIERKQIQIGDHELVVLASWGEPYEVHRTTATWGEVEQWDYGYTRGWVFFRGGRVVMIQN